MQLAKEKGKIELCRAGSGNLFRARAILGFIQPIAGQIKVYGFTTHISVYHGLEFFGLCSEKIYIVIHLLAKMYIIQKHKTKFLCPKRKCYILVTEKMPLYFFRPFC